LLITLDPTIVISRVFWLFLTIIKKQITIICLRTNLLNMYINQNQVIMEKQENPETDQMPIVFERGKGIIANSLSPTIDEPLAVYYFRSGWQYGHPTYHVITEYGDMEQTDYQHMSEEELCKRFGITPEILNEKTDIKVTQETLKDYPNDQDLGRLIRKQFQF